jgi:hypothetical protein
MTQIKLLQTYSSTGVLLQDCLIHPDKITRSRPVTALNKAGESVPVPSLTLIYLVDDSYHYIATREFKLIFKVDSYDLSSERDIKALN